MIRCERATVERGGLVVCESVSLAVAPGHATALVGPTGAGKSSLVAAAATALPLHAGDILIDGRSVRREADAVRGTIGYVPACMPPWPGVRVDEFLELFADTAGLRGAAIDAAIARTLDLAGLAGRGGLEVDALAAGEAKRLLLARALIHEPAVLLLDDPFAGLDPAGRRDAERLVADAHLLGRTVLAAVDDADVPACFTHVAVLSEGRLVAAGPADPAAFAGRTWTRRIACPGRAAEAVRAIGPFVVEAAAIDDDALTCRHDPTRGPFADVLAALVRAGVPVEAATFDPPWPAQLVG
ncbi:MAG: ATP-binding cassette domain-containing protein [Planctomycetaceae bacterium]